MLLYWYFMRICISGLIQGWVVCIKFCLSHNICRAILHAQHYSWLISVQPALRKSWCKCFQGFWKSLLVHFSTWMVIEIEFYNCLLSLTFYRCRGFLKLKMQSTYGAPVAFVDFQVYCHLPPSFLKHLSFMINTKLFFDMRFMTLSCSWEVYPMLSFYSIYFYSFSMNLGSIFALLYFPFSLACLIEKRI